MKLLKTEWPTLLTFLITFAAVAYAWPRSPEVMPVHWGPSGEPDRFGGRFEGLLLIPLIMFAVSALTLASQSFTRSGAQNVTVLRTLRFGLALMAMLLTLRHVFDWPVPRTTTIAVGLMLLLVGNVLGKTQPSPFVGVRTPWTFSSRRAWHATQRRAAVWFTLYGLAIALAAAFVPDAWFTPWVAPVGMVSVLFAITGWLMFTSYRDWRNDPNPEPALERK